METSDPNVFDYEIKKSDKKTVIWNILTILGILAIGVLFGMFGFIYTNPSSGLNPFPPPTIPVSMVLPSATPTPLKLPATWTPAATDTPEPVAASATPTLKLMLATPEAVSDLTGSATPTEPAGSSYPFVLQSEPAAIEAAVLHPNIGCDWMGVGGQVLGLQGQPIPGITVQLSGSLDGKVINLTSLTGTVLQFGDAGYEFKISDLPQDTNGVFWLRLVDQANLPLSGRTYFNTYAECGKNLVVVNFKQIR